MLMNRFLKLKSTSNKDIKVSYRGCNYFILKNKLPLVVCREYKKGKLYAIIAVDHIGRLIRIHDYDAITYHSIRPFTNIRSESDLLDSTEIPNVELEPQNVQQNTKTPVQTVQATKQTTQSNKPVGNQSVIKTITRGPDGAINTPSEFKGTRKQRTFQKTDGYNTGFTYEGTILEEYFPFIEEQVALLKTEFSDCCDVDLQILQRYVEDGVAGSKVGKVKFKLSAVMHTYEWEVVAHLFFNDNHTIVKQLVNLPQDIVDKMYETPCFCDHCKTNRDRVQTFYIRNRNDGRYMQIAKSCMNNQLGINAIAANAAFEDLLELLREDSKVYNSKKQKTTYLYKNDLIASYILHENYSAGLYDDLEPEEKAKAADFIQFIMDIPDEVNRFRNMKQIIKSDYIRGRFVDLAYNAYMEYEKFLEWKADEPTFVKNIKTLCEQYQHELTTSTVVLNVAKEKIVQVEQDMEESRIRFEKEMQEIANGYESEEYKQKNAEAMREYELKLAAYNEYQASKEYEEDSRAALEVATKYGLEAKEGYKIFPSNESVTVMVDRVTLLEVLPSDFDGHMGKYIFKLYNSNLKVYWVTTVEKVAERYNFPSEINKTVIFDKPLYLSGKVKYSSDRMLKLYYCKLERKTRETITNIDNCTSMFDKPPVAPTATDSTLVRFGNNIKYIQWDDEQRKIIGFNGFPEKSNYLDRIIGIKRSITKNTDIKSNAQMFLRFIKPFCVEHPFTADYYYDFLPLYYMRLNKNTYYKVQPTERIVNAKRLMLFKTKSSVVMLLDCEDYLVMVPCNIQQFNNKSYRSSELFDNIAKTDIFARWFIFDKDVQLDIGNIAYDKMLLGSEETNNLNIIFRLKRPDFYITFKKD